LSLVHLVDEPTGAVLCRLLPLDKTANASGRRRSLEPIGDLSTGGPPAVGWSRGGMAPLLVRLLEKRAASGLPPAYLVKDEEP
jgi:putative transposase